MAWFDQTTSGNNTSPNCDPNLPLLQTIIFCCLHGISGFFSFTGNLLVLLAIYQTHHLQTASNIFIASLATADFLVGLVMCPLYIALAIFRANLSYHLLYEVENFFWIQSLAATALNLCAVSVDRYFAVKAALRYHELVTAKKAKMAVVIIWLCSSILASSIFLMGNTEQKEGLFFITQVVTVGVPFVIIFYCYLYIFKTAQRHGRGITGRSSENTTSAHQQAREKAKNHKTALTIAIIIGVFVLLFTPNFVFSVLVFTAENFCQKMMYGRNWYWGLLVVFFSSAANPWIYAIRMREFRNAMRFVLRKVFPCKLVEEIARPAWLEERSAVKGRVPVISD